MILHLKHSRDIFRNLIEFHPQTMQDCQVFLVIGGSKRPIRNYSYFINVDEQAQNVHGVKKKIFGLQGNSGI